MSASPDLHDAITDVAGLAVGHFTHSQRATGCSVVLCPQGAVAGVAVRGGSPGTLRSALISSRREIDSPSTSRARFAMKPSGAGLKSSWRLPAAFMT